MLVYREVLGVDLPDYAAEYLDDRDVAEIAAIAGREKSAPRWSKVDEPLPLDLVLFSVGGFDSHVGLCIGAGRMLHTIKDDHAKIGRYDAPPWAGRLVGFYRWHGEAPLADLVAPPPPPGGSRVILAPYAMDIDRRRDEIVLPAGMTVAGIVAHVLPGLPQPGLERVRVTLVSQKGTAVIPKASWHLVRPHASTNVVITIGHGRGALQLMVAIAASVLAPGIGTALAGSIGIFSATAWTSLVGLGITAAGGILINALFPLNKKKEDKDSFVVESWQNDYRQDEPIPVPLGEIHHAPPLAAASYIEVVGDVLYNRAVFCHGLGQLELWDHKIGETSINDYDEFQIEHRGAVGEPDSTVPLTRYTQQVLEESIGTDLVYEYKRDDAGEQLDTMDDLKPVKRATGSNASHAIIIVSFPSGLGKVTGSGKKKAQSVTIQMRIRKAGTPTWIDQPDIYISRQHFAAFYRAVRVDFPSRGAWEIELTRTSVSEAPRKTDDSWFLTCNWVVLQTFRPEYPFNTSAPLCLTAMRVKATAQMNGQVQTYNCMTRRVTDDFGHGWPTDQPRNPAVSALYVLLGPGLYRPEQAARIDWAKFADWRDFCAAKGLKFDIVPTGRLSLADILKMIGSAGRASIYFDGSRWTVIVDRPQTVPIDVITPRNASNIQFEVAYIDLPDALRIKFQDETNDFQPAERIVMRPGLIGEPVAIESLALPGKTDPDEVFREATRRFYELQHRNVAYRATQDGMARSATRGDLVLASQDIIRRAMSSARVKAVRENLIEIDEQWDLSAGTEYAVGFRVLPADEAEASLNPLGQHVVRRIAPHDGETAAVMLVGKGLKPEPGKVIMVGEYGSESIPLILTGIQRRDDGGSDLALLPAAPEIDELTDATVIPAWDGKVGEVVSLASVVPLAPRIVWARYDAASDKTLVRLEPAPADIVDIAGYTLRHRLSGAGSWSTATSTGASAAVELTGYLVGDAMELQAQATSSWGTDGDWGNIVALTLTGTTLPPTLPAGNIQVAGGLGRAELTILPTAGAAKVEIFSQAGTGGAVDEIDDSVIVLDCIPGQPLTYIHGDGTRAPMFANWDFEGGATGWVNSGGTWTFAGGAVSHSGSAGLLRQLGIGVLPGVEYCWSVDASAVTGSSCRLYLGSIGTADAYGPAIAADGFYSGALISHASSPDQGGIQALTGWAGKLDNLALYQKTPSCVPAGPRTWWVRQISEDDVAGLVSAPIVATIR